MDSRSVVFLEVMIAVAVIGVVAFLVYLVAQYARRPQAAGSGQSADGSRWYEFVLAPLALLAVVALIAWQFPLVSPADGAGDWRAGSGAVFFFVVMLIVAGLGMIVFLIFVFTRRRAGEAEARPGTAEAPGEETARPQFVEVPSAAGLVGLGLLAIAFLVLNWAYVPASGQYALMLHLVYPAGLAVALVLLFDKGTRGWSVKGRGEIVREWLFCDAIVFVFFLAYLNLWQSQAGEAYGAMFWDFLHLVFFLLVFWLLDRKLSRYRFLLAYAYFIALPVLLLIWRMVQEVPLIEGVAWWSTEWPFVILGVIFFVLEIITLVATREGGQQTVAAVKDGLFLVVFAILLIAALPEAAP